MPAGATAAAVSSSAELVEPARRLPETSRIRTGGAVIDLAGGGRLATFVEPAPEEAAEALPGDLFGEFDELVDVAVAAAVGAGPAPQHGQHRPRPDLDPQRLQRHRAAHIGRGRKEVPRLARVPRWRIPEGQI